MELLDVLDMEYHGSNEPIWSKPEEVSENKETKVHLPHFVTAEADKTTTKLDIILILYIETGQHNF